MFMGWKTQSWNHAILPKLVYRVKANLTKITTGIFLELDKLNVKFIWKCKGLGQAKAHLKEEKGEEMEVMEVSLADTKTI